MYLVVAFPGLLLILLLIAWKAARRVAVPVVLAAVLVCTLSSAVNAQRVQFRSKAGLYLPSRISLQKGVLHLRQKVGLSVGARMILTFNERFDVVTGITYIPGYAVLRGAGQQFEVGTGAHRLTASTRARYWLLPPAGMLSWEVHAVVGMVSGGQRAYEDLFVGSTVSGVLGTVVRYQIGRIVSLQLRVQERLYRVRFGGGQAGRPRKPLQVSFGLSFPFLDIVRNGGPQPAAEAERPAGY